jgi:hypothetical protein
VLSYVTPALNAKLGIKGIKYKNLTLNQKITKGLANTMLKSGLNSALYGTDFKDNLKYGLATGVTNLGFEYIGDTSMYQELYKNNTLFSEGSIGKVVLHGAMGAVGAAIAGGDIKAGAISAATNELISPLTKTYSPTTRLAISQITGALSGYAVSKNKGATTGYNISTSAELYNRQLHQKEIEWIKSHANSFAKANNLSKQQAKQLLTLGALGMVDASSNVQIQHLIRNNILNQKQIINAQNFIKEHVVKEKATFQDEYRHYGDVLVSPDSKTQMMFTVNKEQYFNTNYNPNTNLGGIIDNSLDIIPIVKELAIGVNGIKEVGVAGAKAIGKKLDTSVEVPKEAIVKNGDGRVKVTFKDGTHAKVPESVAYDNKGIYDSKAVKKYLEDKYGVENVAKHSVDETTGRNVVETTAGKKGGWNKLLNKDLEPNTDYKVGDTVYKTDKHGRVQEIHYEAKNQIADRNSYQQTKAGETGGYKDALKNDEGGHLQASAHGGAGEQINLLPQDKVLNRSEWKQMENSWTKAASEGKKVEVKIKPVYEGSSKRPSEYRVEYSIDGKLKRKVFPNGGN